MKPPKDLSKRFEQLGTKISPEYAEVLNLICDILNVDVYHMMQWFAYTLVRAASPNHSLTPEVQKIMALLDKDAGWQNAFNLCAPDRKRVAQCILILEQEDHEGFGAVMINRPFFNDATQTECVDDILERIFEVTMRGIYRRFRLAQAERHCDSLADVLLDVLDRSEMLNREEGDEAEGPQMGTRLDNGREVVWGKTSKRRQRHNPDTLAADSRYQQQPLLFTDEAGIEPPDAPKPESWEGEQHE